LLFNPLTTSPSPRIIGEANLGNIRGVVFVSGSNGRVHHIDPFAPATTNCPLACWMVVS
jgi:hypothetical protein